MNYHQITHIDQNNGDGLRVVLWLSGCSHHCNKCQNPQTWHPDSGIIFNTQAEEEVFRHLNKDYISGITLTGGDPLHTNNLYDVLNLIIKIRSQFPDKTIWLYTGYTWEQIFYPVVTDDFNIERDSILLLRKDIVSQCDILVDGKYIDSQRDITLKWRGSSNQRVIDVQKSLQEEKVILYCE